MDAKEENAADNQDLTVGGDGSMRQGTNIEVKTETSTVDEPIVNDLQPPPTADNTSSEETTDVESAVSFIAGGDKDSEDNTEDLTPTNDLDSNHETEVKEQEMPVSDSTPEISEDTNEPIDSSSESFEAPSSAQVNVASGAVAATASPSNSMSNNEQSQPHLHPHRNNKKLAIIITLVVGLIMAGAAVYVFVSAQNNAEEAGPNKTSTLQETQQEEVTPATANDINQSISDIDQTLQSVDETDLSESEISDETLGL